MHTIRKDFWGRGLRLGDVRGSGEALRDLDDTVGIVDGDEGSREAVDERGVCLRTESVSIL